MKSCRTGSIVAFGALFGASAVGACRGEHAPTDIPPVTVAHPTSNFPVISGPIDHPSPSEAATTGSKPLDHLSAPAPDQTQCPVTARFVGAPNQFGTPKMGTALKGLTEDCSLTMLAVVKGKLTVMNETLASGDVLVVRNAKESEVKGEGLAVEAQMHFLDCLAVKSQTEKTVIRGVGTSKLEWAGGKMAAWLDVGTKVSPDLYLGRLEGTAPVAEHVHAGSWEIVASVEASGTFTLDGKEAHLGPRQIVAVPPNTKHAWKPDPGSKLVAIQMYTPPGPEQRFVTLAAEAKDAGTPPPPGSGVLSRPSLPSTPSAPPVRDAGP